MHALQGLAAMSLRSRRDGWMYWLGAILAARVVLEVVGRLFKGHG